MEERYLCKIKATERHNFGSTPENVYGNTVEYVWFDTPSDMYRGVMLRKWCGKTDRRLSPEGVIYSALKDMLSWLISSGMSNKSISLYVENKKVVNQMGGKNSPIRNTYDYADLAKQCKSIVSVFPSISFHQVGFESLFVQQQATEKC